MDQVEIITTGVEAAVEFIDDLDKGIAKGAEQGIRAITRGIRARMRERLSSSSTPAPVGQLGVVSGETRRALRAAYFREKDNSLAGRVYIRKERAHIARFNEKGTRSHGKHGGPLIARLMFATERQNLREADIVQAIDDGIARELGGGLMSLF